MTHNLKWLIGVTALIVLGLGIFLCRRQISELGQSAVTKSNDHASRMTNYSLEGRFDKAIEEGQLALKNSPKNPTILSQMAMVYLIRAKKESAHDEEWILKGSEYALEVAKSSSEKEPITIYNIVEAGRILGLAGDLSGEKCRYYREAIDVLENRGPALNSDTTLVDGKVVSLASVLRQKASTLVELHKKLTDAHCDK